MVFGDLVTAYPKWSLFVISLVVTFFSTLAHKWLTNQEHLRSLKKRQKEIQKELRGCKDENLLKELNLELMKITGVMFKSSMRPMFVTIIPFLILFSWLRSVYVPLIGGGWIWYYIGFVMISSILVRKILNVA